MTGLSKLVLEYAFGFARLCRTVDRCKHEGSAVAYCFDKKLSVVATDIELVRLHQGRSQSCMALYTALLAAYRQLNGANGTTEDATFLEGKF